MDWDLTLHWVASNWGSLISLIGLVLTIATLVVATKAKKAAEDAKAEARRRNLAEELLDAQRKVEQVGFFIRDGKWELVFLRCQEVGSTCNIIRERWVNELDAVGKDRIFKAQIEADSIAEVASKAAARAPTFQQQSTVAAAQRRLHAMLSLQLGQSLGDVEGGITIDDRDE